MNNTDYLNNEMNDKMLQLICRQSTLIQKLLEENDEMQLAIKDLQTDVKILKAIKL